MPERRRNDMRTAMVKTVLGLGVLLLLGLALAEPPPSGGDKPKPANPVAVGDKATLGGPVLTELLDRALKDNPDVRVAEAKLREAEAELNRARLLVMQKVVALQRAVEDAKS